MSHHDIMKKLPVTIFVIAVLMNLPLAAFDGQTEGQVKLKLKNSLGWDNEAQWCIVPANLQAEVSALVPRNGLSGTTVRFDKLFQYAAAHKSEMSCSAWPEPRFGDSDPAAFLENVPETAKILVFAESFASSHAPRMSSFAAIYSPASAIVVNTPVAYISNSACACDEIDP